MLERVRRTYRPCDCPGCNRRISPGDPHYPFCTASCRGRAHQLRADEVHVVPVRAGQAYSAEAKGGGVIHRPAVIEGVLVRKGDGPGVFVPRTAVEAALAVLDGRPRKVNGHGR